MNASRPRPLARDESWRWRERRQNPRFAGSRMHQRCESRQVQTIEECRHAHPNGVATPLPIDPGVSLLELLREHLHLFGAEKGCDRGRLRRAHGTGRRWRRILSCFALAVQHEAIGLAAELKRGVPSNVTDDFLVSWWTPSLRSTSRCASG